MLRVLLRYARGAGIDAPAQGSSGWVMPEDSLAFPSAETASDMTAFVRLWANSSKLLRSMFTALRKRTIVSSVIRAI